MRFVVFTDTSNFLTKYIKQKILCDLVAGGFAGFVSVMVNNPVDVIKTRMQGVEHHQFNGFLDCGK